LIHTHKIRQLCAGLEYLQPTLCRGGGLGRTLFATIASADASGSTSQWLQRSQGKITTAARLLRSNNLAGHELGVGVGEVGHVAHDGVHSGLVLGGLLEVGHAAPLEGGLDAVRSVVSELEDLWYVSDGWI
jgi:hypothetical protein